MTERPGELVRRVVVQELEQAGLALPGRSGRGHYDRFRDRVVFPITNLSGRTIAFGARAEGIPSARGPVRRRGRPDSA